MRKFLCALILIFTSAVASYAQDANQNTGRQPALYVGLSTGLENPSGYLGFDAELPVDHFSVGGGVGLSTWGIKFYAQGKYYLKPSHKGWAFGLGLSHNTGISGVKVDGIETTTGEQNLVLNFKPQTNLFWTVHHYFRMGNRHRFFVMAGYSARLRSTVFEYNGPYILQPVVNEAMKWAAPGGFMAGLGFSFGI